VSRPLGVAVLGGTGRLQTRQLPLSPHTWHDHGAPTPAGCDAMGHDDQPALCADPDPRWALADPALLDESRGALAALTDILSLGDDFYPFQRV
jgi:hypothetical protein